MLIVDDDYILIATLIRIFQHLKSKYFLDIAMDGSEALRRVLNFHPHLIILDLKLPGINGFEICETIRAQPETFDSKILAITGYDIPLNRKKILASGADDYLPKPFELNKLMKKIDRLLEEE